MADLPVIQTTNDLTKPNVTVLKLLKEQKIAEKRARVERLRTDAREIMDGKLKGIEADIIMGERDIAKLITDLDDLERHDDRETIEVSKK